MSLITETTEAEMLSLIKFIIMECQYNELLLCDLLTKHFFMFHNLLKEIFIITYICLIDLHGGTWYYSYFISRLHKSLKYMSVT